MRKFFTLLTAVLATTAVWAQFDEPELKPATGVSIDGTTEYILSVKNSEGTEYFYGKGNNWGTRTSVKEAAEEALTVRFSAITQTIDEAQVECVRFNNYVSDKGGWNAYADCDTGLSAWVDGQGRTGDGLWQLKDLGNGQIELTNLNAPGGKFGVSWTVQNWSADDKDYIDGTGELDFDNRCYFIGAEVGKSYIINEEGDTTDVKDSRIYGENICTTWTLYNASLYNAQKQLYDWYWESYAEYEGNAGVDAAVAAAAKVYENANATPAELNAAYDAIIAAIDMIAVEENSALLEGASVDDPVDATFAIKNPDFSEGEPSTGSRPQDWEMSFKGSNQYQSAKYTNGDITIEGFAETWTGSAQQSGDGAITQKIGLPEGMYKLEADIICIRQSGSKADSKGGQLFYQGPNGEESFVEVATNNNSPEHFSLVFKTKGGVITIGARLVSPTVNWFAVDNFKLTYYGNPEQTIEQINLKSVIDTYTKNYENLKGEDGEIHAKNSEIDAFDKALESAIAAYESGDYTEEQFVEFGDSIKSKYSKLSSSVNDYKYFAQCIATVEARVEEFNETNPACAGEIADYLEELRTAYAEQEWVRSQMEEILPNVSTIMGKYADVQPGDDVTFYLNNAAFQKDFSGWQITGTSPWWAANHAQGENNNAAEDFIQEIPAEDDGLAECFHAKFTMSQTIKNVPAGLYTLSVQGFNRHDNGNTESAVLFAQFSNGEEQTVPFATIDDYATEYKLYDNGQWSADATRTINGETYYAPNGMTGSAWHFVNKKDGENYDYTNKFSILMKEAGDLTVGVRCDNANQWVIFDNFRLVYEGSGSMVWEATIQDEITKLDNKATHAEITDGCYLEISEVIKKAETFCKEINDKSEDECLAMLDELKAQYDVIAENLDLIKQLVANYEALEDVSALAEEADAELKARYDAIWAKVDSEYSELTNAELKEAIEEAKAVVALVKMPKGWENASDENPVDFSKLIVNRHFNSNGEETDTPYDEEPEATANYTFTAWQGKQPGTGGGTPGNCGEVWNSSAFDAYQELSGLPAGTYELSCQGFLRHGGGTADSYSILNGEKAQEVYAYLYAESAEGKYSKELENIASVQLTTEEYDSLGISANTTNFGNGFKGADQLATADQFFKAGYYNNSVTVKVGADGALRVGFKKVGAVGQDWVVVDNFSLIYLGNASTAETSGDDATAINEVALTAQKAIYTLTGVRVSKAVKPGLYIINGKKIVVK